jgi:Rod binding domain-containing protein
MDISQTSEISSKHLTSFLGQSQQPQNLEEAAEQFEQVLVRQLVTTMTDDLFDSPLAGKQSGAMQSQGRLQSDALTDTLTAELVKHDSFGLSELLMKKWRQ